VPATAVAAPAEHRPLVGADAEYCPSAGPHTPLTTRLAEQLTLLPPLIPLQFQSNGPAPTTAVALPVAQRPDVGLVYTLLPFAGPHDPWTFCGALQIAVVPPLIPLQFQFHV